MQKPVGVKMGFRVLPRRDFAVTELKEVKSNLGVQSAETKRMEEGLRRDVKVVTSIVFFEAFFIMLGGGEVIRA